MKARGMKSGRLNRRAMSESQLANEPTRPRTASTETNTFGESVSLIGTSTMGSLPLSVVTNERITPSRSTVTSAVAARNGIRT